MKLYAPKYYKNFRCIADRCRHSCCIGWEIDIDEVTAEKYASLTDGYGKEIKNSIAAADPPHFILTDGERCPHLDERGLCRIITNLGEDCLCAICREHPRFYHDTPMGKEVGIGMACEEACRIILGSGEYMIFEEIGEADGFPEPLEFDALTRRAALYDILADDSVSHHQKLCRIGEEYDVSPALLSDEEWAEVLCSLEYLNEEHKGLFSVYSSCSDVTENREKMLERFLAYFIFRYCSDAGSEDEFRISLGFCLFCERLFASLLRRENVTEEDACELARIISEEIEYSEDNVEAIKFEFSF
ncbi:MAG: hypothetical protein E7638_02175 [Ruminococcaceae bacterium]|nr:hypothetical protein [Oscillospiraceae bacterium]